MHKNIVCIFNFNALALYTCRSPAVLRHIKYNTELGAIYMHVCACMIKDKYNKK